MSQRIIRLWEKANRVANNNYKKDEKKQFIAVLDDLMDLTICPHPIYECKDKRSGCLLSEPEKSECIETKETKECKKKVGCEREVHTYCNCPPLQKVARLKMALPPEKKKF